MSDSTAVRQTETIPEWKRTEVNELVSFVEQFESVGVVGVAGIPSRQLQSMRRELHGSASLRVSRNTLTTRALESVGEGFEALTDYVNGQVALVGTDDNPFGLYKQLEESKTPAPISAGETAPDDIIIEEGDTGVDPGPFVGELQQVGASARIMQGSIKVTEDSKVLEAGEPVSEELAGVLGELGIEPKEVGLDLRGVHSDGVFFEPEELAIDADAYQADIETAAAHAQNLAVNAAIATEAVMPALVRTAAGNGRALGLDAAIENRELMTDLIARADTQLRSVAAQIDDEDALPEELTDIEPEPEPEEPVETGEESPEEEPESTSAGDADDMTTTM
ncbi:MAG: ribosomal protein L10, partial [Haloquadratum sp. J07HQX50]